MREAAPCEQPGLQPRLCQVAADGGGVLPRGSWAVAAGSAVSVAPLGGESTRHPRNLIRYVRMGSAVRGGVGLAKATRRLAAKGIKSWAKDQKVRGWSKVRKHGECSLQRFLLPTFNYLADKAERDPFTTTGFYSRKGTFWSLTEADRAYHLLGSFPDCTTGHPVGLLTPLSLGS